MRTPETLTAVERAAQLRQRGSTSATGESTGSPASAPTQGAKPMTAQEKMRESARAALNKGSANATANLDPLEEVDGSLTILSINEIDPYKYNPRTKPNPARANLKASMKAEGITNVITVTRRSPKEKYFPYGGGNTRIELAKELYAEGEDRFATLAVVTKKWPGEAAVITAHLSENDNRGDISFWERAQGVAAFKREFERESGRILTAAEINRELKERGLNYGLKSIQNFAFATEHLYPVGPWLQTTEVNEIIRPLIGAIQELSRKGDAAGQVKAAIDEILLMHGQDLESLELSNKDTEPGSRTEVRLDVQSLITDLQSVSSKVLRLDADRMPQILKEVIGNPKASFADLTSTRKEPSDKPPGGQGKARQMPLGPMLGSVPTGKAPAPSMERERSATAPGSETQEERLAVFSQQLTNDFLALNDVVPISDFIRVEPGLPFGFLVDFPQASDAIAGQSLTEEQAGMREAIWPILAALSGQCSQPLMERCSLESGWAEAVARGPSELEARCAAIRAPFRNGLMYVTSFHFLFALSTPRVGPVLSAVLKTIFEFSKDHPELTNAPFKHIFAN
ncbi:hypothetical protein [Paracidovorax oryzae]|uniref:hypothetical protein n=1 Tax=Paracidovorax oryzae TaxID=862720 RepID=UPI0002F2E33F|nr:hypothetical protein [Paracidovorax oryzae]